MGWSASPAKCSAFDQGKCEETIECNKCDQPQDNQPEAKPVTPEQSSWDGKDEQFRNRLDQVRESFNKVKYPRKKGIWWEGDEAMCRWKGKYYPCTILKVYKRYYGSSLRYQMVYKVSWDNEVPGARVEIHRDHDGNERKGTLVKLIEPSDDPRSRTWSVQLENGSKETIPAANLDFMKNWHSSDIPDAHIRGRNAHKCQLQCNIYNLECDWREIGIRTGSDHLFQRDGETGAQYASRCNLAIGGGDNAIYNGSSSSFGTDFVRQYGKGAGRGSYI